MSIHSKFIIHWTGRDLNSSNSPITPKIRQHYVGRLKNDCQNGLFMRPGEEKINGRNNTWIQAKITRVCFSEIKLSVAEKHANLYGKLGIGFERSFIVSRLGNPAIYVQNAANGLIVESFDKMRGFVNGNQSMTKSLEIALGFVKNMSPVTNQNFELYDEMEWRIVLIDDLIDTYIVTQNSAANIYRLIFQPSDIKLIVFPDKDTKEIAMQDSYIRSFFNNSYPIMVTIQDCKNF